MSWWREEKSYHESCKSINDKVSYYCLKGFVKNNNQIYCPIWFPFDSKLSFQNLYYREANNIVFKCLSFEEAKEIIKLFASSCDQDDQLIEYLGV